MSILRFKSCFKGTGSSFSVVGTPEVDSEVREEPSKGSEASSSLFSLLTGLKYPPVTVYWYDMKITILTQSTRSSPTSFKYAVVTTSPMIVMATITAYGKRYGYFIQIWLENIAGKWSWGRASQPPISALWNWRSATIKIFSISF